MHRVSFFGLVCFCSSFFSSQSFGYQQSLQEILPGRYVLEVEDVNQFPGIKNREPAEEIEAFLTVEISGNQPESSDLIEFKVGASVNLIFGSKRPRKRKSRRSWYAFHESWGKAVLEHAKFEDQVPQFTSDRSFREHGVDRNPKVLDGRKHIKVPSAISNNLLFRRQEGGLDLDRTDSTLQYFVQVRENDVRLVLVFADHCYEEQTLAYKKVSNQ